MPSDTGSERMTQHRSDATDTTLNLTGEFAAQMAALEGGVTTEELDAIAALPSGSALLIVRRGPNAGARFLLDKLTSTVGRHPDADILLDDVTVSRRHAEFSRSGTTFIVRDLHSLNGTYFDGVRVDDALLSDGSEIQVGKFRLTFYPSRRDVAANAPS
ncbi:MULTISPECIES: FHA domain-containing protein [Subtercola]|nr:MULTISPECIES: FHA domain-containing protein [Subtercola]MEA9986021.1 FHA domain-containing protein [Subtercola sp. RTI3]